MENIKTLTEILKKLCNGQQVKDGCESCPAYNLCDSGVWVEAERELEYLGVEINLTCND